MAERSIFDSLVARLSADERRDLLDRVRSGQTVSEEPFYPQASIPKREEADYAARAEALGVIGRLVLFLRVVLTGKSRETILREDGLREIAHRVEARGPGLVDHRRSLLLRVVAEQLRLLRDAARFFHDAIERSVDRDKASFFAFLASIEMPEVHAALLERTDPAKLEVEQPRATESEVRAKIMDAYDEIFSGLPDAGRKAMYVDLRSLLFLKRLSGFPFERLLGAFRPTGAAPGAEGASFRELRDLFLDLGDVLFSLASPPSASLVSALFVFAEREEIARSGADAAKVVGSDVAKTEEALERIRVFFKRVPLADVLRLVSGDPSYGPRELPGGEDWLAVYRAFWRERVERQIDEWRTERRFRELAAEVEHFVGQPGPQPFAHVSRSGRPTSPPVRFQPALSFLDGFYRGPFLRELSRPFKILLVDGEFYRKDNRVEYTDAYEALLRLPESLAVLDSRLGPEGELGGAWVLANAEMTPAPQKRRKLQALARNAEDEAELIVRRAGRSFATLVHVIRGVLKGEAGGRYDTLTNLSYLDGRANKDFIAALDQAKDRCERAYGLLAELSGLDLSEGE